MILSWYLRTILNQSLIKKQIQMMNKKLSNPKNKRKAVFLLSIFLLVLSMAGQVKANESLPNVKVNYKSEFYDIQFETEKINEQQYLYKVIATANGLGKCQSTFLSNKENLNLSFLLNDEIIGSNEFLSINPKDGYSFGCMANNTISVFLNKKLNVDNEKQSNSKPITDKRADKKARKQRKKKHYKKQILSSKKERKSSLAVKDSIHQNTDIYIDGAKTTKKEIDKAVDVKDIDKVSIAKDTLKTGTIKRRISISTKREKMNVNVDAYSLNTIIDEYKYNQFISSSKTKYYIDGMPVGKQSFTAKKEKGAYYLLLFVTENEDGKAQNQKLSILTKEINAYSKEELNKIKNIHLLPPPSPSVPPSIDAYSRNTNTGKAKNDISVLMFSDNSKIDLNKYNQLINNPKTKYYIDGNTINKQEFINKKNKSDYESLWFIESKKDNQAQKIMSITTKAYNDFSAEELKRIKSVHLFLPPATPPAPNFDEVFENKVNKFYLNGEEISWGEAQKYKTNKARRRLSVYQKKGYTAVAIHTKDSKLGEQIVDFVEEKPDGSKKTHYSTIVEKKTTEYYTTRSMNEDGPPPTPQTKKEEAINYNFVENKPKYPNGDEALIGEIQQKMTMPESLKSNPEFKRGVLVTRFVVEKDGSVQRVKLVKNIKGCTECEKKVKSILTNLKHKFTTGTQNGKPVQVWYTLPILLKNTK